MPSIFEAAQSAWPAAVLVKAILVAIAANVLILAFILARRTYRRCFFAKRDARLLEFRRNWDALISGEIPYHSWRAKSFDVEIVESIVLDAFETANRDQAAQLLKFLRASGLIEKLIFEARQFRGWKRNRALVALGRTRAPEGMPALGEALRDRDRETRLAALRALGRTACPQAGMELLNWVAENGLQVPALPLQAALIDCCAERPRMLLPFLQVSEKTVREVIARVLGEIATPALASELLQFVEDDQPELRAAAARALSCGDSACSAAVLSELAQDPVWFVRLRAVVSLGKTRHPEALGALLRCIRDSHRLVRLRAAEALLELPVDPVRILEQVAAAKDRYALHAYLTALDNAGLQAKLAQAIQADTRASYQTKATLLEIVGRNPVLPETTSPEKGLARAASQP